MNSRAFFIGLFILSISPMSFAASLLELPNSVEVTVFNGKAYERNDDIALEKGQNQIVFRYVVNYRDNGMQTLFNSNAVVLTFDADDAQYQLTLPTIRNKNAANKFNREPEVNLSSNQSDSVPHKIDVLRKSGIQIGRDYVEEMHTYNQTQQVAAVAAFAPALTAPTATTGVTSTTAPAVAVAPIATTSTAAVTSQPKVVTPKTIAEDQAEISEMLDYWYNKANQDTKAKFKAKINQ
ncbi:DUF2057 domain-containing protein [Shewanella olleyana]|uniref:YccT family protein n=1 Tax=Shewanella olleyana TaxID=135626 RepID=UPI0020104568|nr:DUF2057 domain-containing protein [Shewanella olleyana]MCL1065746.1 DUF2057 domain-containing protein [Shewanella olleyana]